MGKVYTTGSDSRTVLPADPAAGIRLPKNSHCHLLNSQPVLDTRLVTFNVTSLHPHSNLVRFIHPVFQVRKELQRFCDLLRGSS